MQNPFLMDDADFGAPAAGTASSNPFLSGGDFEATGLSENPFLSAMGGDPEQGAATYMATNGASTNPFAAFAVDPAPAPEPNGQAMGFYGAGDPSYGYTMPQGQPAVATTAGDFYGTPAPPIDVRQVPSTLDLKDGAAPSIVAVSDYCAETSDIFAASGALPPSQPSSGRSTPKGGPRRPPPPRPVPPSQETKNLIQSVMGEMEATSSHLLDRLPPTREPSPTLLRDLQSPSPTPDAPYSDFLGVGGGVAPDTSGGAQEANLLGDLGDIVTMPPPLIASGQVEAAPATASADIMGMFDSEPPAAAAAFTQPMAAAACEDAAAPEPHIAAPAPASDMEPQQPVAVEPPPEPQKTTPPTVTPVTAAAPPPVGPPARPPPARPPPARPPVPSPAKVVSPAVSPPAPAPASATEAAPGPAPDFPPPLPEPPRVPSVVTTPVQPPPEAAPFAAPVELEQPDMFNATSTPYGATAKKAPAEIMNLFGSDTAAVNALNSAPAQAADDFFGGGGGFTAQAHGGPGDRAFGQSDDAFDAFTAKFESASVTTSGADAFGGSGDAFGGGGDAFGGGGDAFGGGGGGGDAFGGGDAWGSGNDAGGGGGFGEDSNFDAFLSMQAPPVPQSTPARVSRAGSADSDDGLDFSVVIKPQGQFGGAQADGADSFVPVLAPPPVPTFQQNAADASAGSRFNPFDKSGEMGQGMGAGQGMGQVVQQEPVRPTTPPGQSFKRSDSAETPPTPLFDEDTSYPLEDFPRIHYNGPGWEMQLRQPNRKKITGQRFWKKIFIKLVYQGDNPVLQLFNAATDKDPFQELPLQPCYCVSDISAQQFDQYGKIFTVKLQYVFYKERPGVRPGQVTKAERITNKLSQFAAYAIQGDYQGCKEFASDLKKLGMPVEHAPQISQLFKIGSLTYEDMKQFSIVVEEALFKLPAHRDRALNYKQEEVQITAVDEVYVEQDKYGHVDRQIARVRLFFLGFLSGMPDIEIGVNELSRQGKEVVGRHDIIPVITEEWIRLENVEFAACVQLDEYDRTKTIKFKPPDACYLELMRFRVRPPRNRELPLQLKAVMCVTGNKVELRADILVPGFSSRKYGQIPCEDIAVRFPIPECWIYLFRVEKHFRYGSVKSAHRRAGKVKGIERFLGTMETMEQHLLEVTSGQAKYEHQHRSIVWRMSRLPKEGQGAYTTHTLVCRMCLTSYDQIPAELAQYAYVEFTMPQTQVSHTTVRSVSIQPQPDEPPEKYVRQLSRHEYRVGIEHTQGQGPGAYIAATSVSKPAVPEPVPEERPAAAAESDSDSD